MAQPTPEDIRQALELLGAPREQINQLLASGGRVVTSIEVGTTPCTPEPPTPPPERKTRHEH